MPPTLSRRAERTLGPALTLRELNLICWGCFIAFLVLPLCVVVRGRTYLPDVDFVNFYAMGRILNEYSPDKLYDADLQTRIRTEVHPLRMGAYAAVPYPPFVGILFRPLARMPYRAAYALWLTVTLILYLAGLAILSARSFRREPLRRSLIFCFALAFYPFVMNTLINGQVAAIGFFALILAVREEDLGRPFLSGLALSACLYKPTLLVLVLPMLLVTRRFRSLLGFATGAIALALLTAAVEGARVWSGYVDLLLRFGKDSVGVHTRSFLPLPNYVDLSTFSSLLPGGRSWLGLAVLSGLACVAALSLFRVWWKSTGAGEAARTLAWAATLTWTLLLNVYVPIYDAILVVPSIVATAGVLKACPKGGLHRWFTFVWLLIFACSWVTVGVAEATGLQIMTVLLAGLGTLQLTAFYQIVASRQPLAGRLARRC